MDDFCIGLQYSTVQVFLCPYITQDKGTALFVCRCMENTVVMLLILAFIALTYKQNYIQI